MTSRRTIALGLLAVMLVSLAGSSSAQQSPQECLSRLPEQRVSVDLRGVDVQTTLRLLSQQYRINMVVTNEVTGTVTLSFFDVPVRNIFHVILEAANLECVERGGVLRVSSAARVRGEEEARARAEDARRKTEEERARAAGDASKADAERRRIRVEAEREELALRELQALGPVREDTIQLSYADALEVAYTLQGMLGFDVGGPASFSQQTRRNTFCESDSGESQQSQASTAPPVNIPGLPGAYSGSRLPGALPGAPQVPQTTTVAVAPPQVARENLGQGLTIRGHRPTNTIFIRHFDVVIERVRRLIKERFDMPRPQVQIAAQMVITSMTALEQIGIQWGGSFADQRSSRSPTLIGSGFATPNPGGGIGLGAGEFTPVNQNLNLSSVLPVSPTTGLPLGGNLVNLPTSLLPTVANPALGLLFGIVGSQFNINLAIQALETEGKARSIAEPKVVTIENQCAIISRGFEVPFVSQSGLAGTNVQFKDALLKLEVIPAVVRENGGIAGIKMRVFMENNEPDFSRAVAGNPPIFKRRAATEVLVREGERLVIGGVMVESDNNSVRQVPVLGRVPILGWLFKSREISNDRQELIVILTPSVVPALTGPATAR